MSMTQADLLRKASGTGSLAVGDFTAAPGGQLNPEQSTAFLDAIYDATPLNQAIRPEKRRAKSGSIAKVSIGGRLLRPKTAGVDDSKLVKPLFSDVPYATAASRLDWEVDEEVYQQNIEQAGFEDHLMRLMTNAIGIDLEDLHLNGDTTDASADAQFLNQNEGWLRQLATGGIAHRINGAATNGGNVSKDHFGLCIQAVPAKFQTGALRWLLSPITLDRYADYLTNRGTPAGDAVLIDGKVTQIRGIPVLVVPKMPNTRVLLCDPKNLIAVNTQEIRVRKTTEGREAIREDKRFYAVFLDDDPIIQEQDGVGDVYGLAA